MRAGGNFHPEWGYLAPAPSFMRTARIVAVATAIGATAGAAVVLSLAGSSGSGSVLADGEKSLVVVHSFVQPAEAASAIAQPVAPPDVTAPVIVPSATSAAAANASPNVNAQASVQSANSNVVPLPPAAQISPPAASESRSASTPAVPASVAALAEISPATDASAASAASQVTVAPDQTGAARDGGKKPRGTDQAQQRGPQVAATAKKRPDEPHGFGPLLRHLFSARAGSSYYPN